MKTYGQYCPIARASEILAERWTLLIVRNLLAGARTFTDIRNGLPGIPPALLTQRLGMLTRHGIVERSRKRTGRGYEFALTPQGRELEAVCDALGTWGARWLEIRPHHRDAAYALWATAKLADVERLPRRRIVVRFDLRSTPATQMWMILDGSAEVCAYPPGATEDLVVTTDASTLIEVNLRSTTFADAKRSGRIRVEGPPQLAKRFGEWFRPSPFAGVPPRRPRDMPPRRPAVRRLPA